MGSNYKRLGNYIKERNNRNVELKAKELLGININKFFMPSVANIVGTDMSTYKIVKPGQFACNRMHVGRDYRLPVALSNREKEFMVSPAYDVFEIIDTKELLPEYLMMWFSRNEFDRNAWFYTDADVRGGLQWKAFIEMELPVPHPDKQREIIKEYNTIVDQINLNNQLVQKLEEAAQAIYKQWFVDFEFPDEEGKPYKSNGGEMEWNEEFEMEVPKGWEHCKLKKVTKTQYGFTASAENENIGPKFLRITDIAQRQINWHYVPHCRISSADFSKYSLMTGDIVVARTGATAGFAKRINKFYPKAVFASYLVRIVPYDPEISLYLGMTVDSKTYRNYILNNAEGSAQPQANASLMTDYQIINPCKEQLIQFNKLIQPVVDLQELYQIQITSLLSFKELLLSKLATIEN